MVARALRVFVWMMVVTGLIYPLCMTLLARLLFPRQAGGSLVRVEGRVAGSALIAQSFHSARYFWPRPSAGDYQTLPSRASNLGPTNLKLQSEVEARRKELFALYRTAELPSDLLFTSASGLDPHISLEAAHLQIERVAKARAMDSVFIKELVGRMAEGGFFGFLDYQYVNVLLINLALDHKEVDGGDIRRSSFQFKS